MKTVGVGGLVAVVFIVVADSSIAPRTVTSTLSMTSTSSPSGSPSRPPVEPASRRSADGADAIIDLYGNEVTDAVAQYTLDPAGSLYELHSPQTELPRLGSPKS